MENSLSHWGIRGMHWGQRRYQNPDGTLTEAGKRRYYGSDSNYNAIMKRFNKKATYHKDNNKNPITRMNFSDEQLKEILGGEREYERIMSKMREDENRGRIEVSKIKEGMFLDHEEAKLARERGEQMIQQLESYSVTAKSVGGLASEAGRTLGRGYDQKKEIEKVIKADYEAKHLSIDELRERTARLTAEEYYIAARTKELKRGERKTEDILQNVGSYIGLAASGINAYTSYRRQLNNND